MNFPLEHTKLPLTDEERWPEEMNDDPVNENQNQGIPTGKVSENSSVSVAPSDLITVCDHCLQASCWQAIFF